MPRSPRPVRAARLVVAGAALLTGAAVVAGATGAAAATAPRTAAHTAAHTAARTAVRTVATPATATTSGYRIGGANLSDTMHRHVSPGWGVAALGGGPYHVSAGARFSVNGSVAAMQAVPSGMAADALLPEVSHTNELVQLDFSMPTLSPYGLGPTVTVELRLNGAFTEAYRARVRVSPHGSLIVSLSVLHHHVEYPIGNTDVLKTHRVKAGQIVHLQGMVAGTGNVLLRARAWIGSRIPAWQATAHDTSSTRIAGPGAIGIWSYTSGKSPASTIWAHRLTGWGLHAA